MSNVMTNGGFSTVEEVYENYGADQASGEEYLKRIYVDNKALSLVVDQAKVNYTKAEEPAEGDTQAGTSDVQNTEQ